MKKSTWHGLKALSVFMFLCFAMLLGTGLGAGAAQAATFDPTATYRFINQNSNKSLDVQYQSLDQGANIHQWTYVGVLSQQWNIQPTDDGYYKIVNANSGKVVDVEGPSTANGANIHQWDYVGGDNQKWSIEPVGSSYRLVSKYSGKVLDVQYNSTADGANIHQWDYVAGTTSQLWNIEQVSIPGNPFDPHQFYKIKLTNSTKVMDIYGPSTGVTKTQLWDDLGSDSQKWKIVPYGSNTYTIMNKYSNMDVTTGRACSGTNCVVQQWDPGYGSQQMWYIEQVSTGVYRFKNFGGGYIYGGGDLFTDTSIGYSNNWNIVLAP